MTRQTTGQGPVGGVSVRQVTYTSLLLGYGRYCANNLREHLKLRASDTAIYGGVDGH